MEKEHFEVAYEILSDKYIMALKLLTKKQMKEFDLELIDYFKKKAKDGHDDE